MFVCLSMDQASFAKMIIWVSQATEISYLFLISYISYLICFLTIHFAPLPIEVTASHVTNRTYTTICMLKSAFDFFNRSIHPPRWKQYIEKLLENKMIGWITSKQNGTGWMAAGNSNYGDKSVSFTILDRLFCTPKSSDSVINFNIRKKISFKKSI